VVKEGRTKVNKVEGEVKEKNRKKNGRKIKRKEKNRIEDGGRKSAQGDLDNVINDITYEVCHLFWVHSDKLCHNAPKRIVN